MSELNMKIVGMSCDGCVRPVSRALLRVNGVQIKSVEVGRAVITFDPACATEQDIVAVVQKAGYQVEKPDKSDRMPNDLHPGP